ncbi:MAG: SWIM zinc finger family protein [Actinomycetota bacterium]|nr:SWIM zinc finger family protein [Actinomycetota bacterium]
MAGLAPDAASLKAGRGLAGERHWSGLGRSERAVWGLCQGSGAKPYQSQVDLAGPAFRCSCPSRKFPCKHALALLLLTSASPELAPAVEPPDWVTEWLASREQRVERAQARAEGTQAPPDPEAQARRQARREERVLAGLEELERWLHDLVRQGLAQARQRPYAFWDEAAARLVDAQASALAGRLRVLGGLAAAGGDQWAEAMLEEAGLVQLLVRAYRRADQLPETLRADVRSLIGWTVSQEDVLAGDRVRDSWAVLAREVSEEERLRVQRVWLQGLGSGRQALVLSFAAAGQPLEGSFATGMAIDASLAFYPSALPLRALVAEQHAAPVPLERLPGNSIEATLAARADALAHQPWLARLPLCLGGVVPVAQDDGWLAVEPEGDALALACDRRSGWRLAALAGGRPLTLFGEWLGDRVRPLSVHAEGRFVLL